MKSNNSVLLLGGDKRMLAAAEHLKNSFDHVYQWGFGSGVPSGVIPLEKPELDEAIKKTDIMILPLPVCKDGKEIFSSTGAELSIPTLASKINGEKTIFAGMIDKRTASIFEGKGCTVTDYYKMEDVIIKNALLTAQGTLALVLQNIDYSLSFCKGAVTGYGRTAKPIALFLKNLGADISIFARDPAARAEAQTAFLKSYPIEALKEKAGGFDIIINTVPSLIINRSVIESAKKSAVIIDISSAPFGTDFLAAREKGIKTVKAGSLPGKAAAKTAGIIIAEAILSSVGGERNE